MVNVWVVTIYETTIQIKRILLWKSHYYYRFLLSILAVIRRLTLNGILIYFIYKSAMQYRIRIFDTIDFVSIFHTLTILFFPTESCTHAQSIDRPRIVSENCRIVSHLLINLSCVRVLLLTDYYASLLPFQTFIVFGNQLTVNRAYTYRRFYDDKNHPRDLPKGTHSCPLNALYYF